MFKKALIANRGEIACRIIATARRMGIATVAVYSEADTGAMHVRLADEAWPIGPAPARESYLRAEKIVDVARKSGAQAVHPGYGFLSESAEFAEACGQAGLVFIGPSPEAMRAVGGKAAAKALMARIGVPVIPGFHGEAQDLDTFAAAAERIGFPVVVKASAGGGGRGMRVVMKPAELALAMESARREAILAFGDGRLLLEKYLHRPRHVEIQLVADSHGDVTTFWERDCSIQRNHQKLVEETPASGLSPGLREALRESAATIARASAYTGAGTVEFLLHDDAFYFLEVNSRLQVEHPVTEMISGIDLVEWQFRIASGERVPLRQHELAMRGSSIEARICAEDPAEGFRPSSGLIERFHSRDLDPRVRIEAGVQTGDVVSPYYDSLLAKIVVWDEERAGAVRKIQNALWRIELVGVETNLEFLRQIVSNEGFVAGVTDTSVIAKIDRARPTLTAQEELTALAAGVALWRDGQIARTRGIAQRRGEASSPWATTDGWRLYGDVEAELGFLVDGRVVGCRLRLLDARSFSIETSSGRLAVSAQIGGTEMSLSIDGILRKIGFVSRPKEWVVIVDGRNFIIEWIDPLVPPAQDADAEKPLVAPLPARVTRILVNPGDRVERGAQLLLLEAMKMEISVDAPREGVINEILCVEGQSVSEGDELVVMAEVI